MTCVYAEYDSIPSDKLEEFIFEEMRFKVPPVKAKKGRINRLRKKTSKMLGISGGEVDIYGAIIALMHIFCPLFVVVSAIYLAIGNINTSEIISKRFNVQKTCVAQLKKSSVEESYKYCAPKTMAELNEIQRYIFSNR